MIGAVQYTTLEALNVSMARDNRFHAVRLEEFFISFLGAARSSVNQVAANRILVSERFDSECPPAAMNTLKDCSEIMHLGSVKVRNHGPHSYGDPSKLMSCHIALVSYGDLLQNILADISFFQYLAPSSTIVCIQYGASGDVAPAPNLLDVVRYFSSSDEAPSAKFLRATRSMRH